MGDCIDGLRFGECAVRDAEAKPTKKKYPRNGRRLEFVIWGRRVPPKRQDEFEITTVIPDREQAYDPDAPDILGVPIHPEQHGLTDWVDRQDKPTRGGDVVKARLHCEEVLELEKSRHLKVKGNTGGCRPLRANEDFMEWKVDNREVIEEETAVYREELQPEPRTEREAAQQDLQNLVAESKKPVYWDGEEFQFLEDQEYFRGQVIRRGKDQNKTDDERLDEAQDWKMICQELAKRLRAGEGWSPTDPREHDRILPNGVKVNLENRRVREILYEIDLHGKNYDTKEQLAAAYGLKYETLRKRNELMSINANKTCPTTPFTKEQIEHLKKKDGRAVFVHVVADRPRWYILDLDRYETYQEALEAIKREGIDEALRKNATWMNDRAPKAAHTAALKEVWARWNAWFRPTNIYILDLRSPMLGAIAEEEWEAVKT